MESWKVKPKIVQKLVHFRNSWLMYFGDFCSTSEIMGYSRKVLVHFISKWIHGLKLISKNSSMAKSVFDHAKWISSTKKFPREDRVCQILVGRKKHFMTKIMSDIWDGKKIKARKRQLLLNFRNFEVVNKDWEHFDSIFSTKNARNGALLTWRFVEIFLVWLLIRFLDQAEYVRLVNF